MFPSLHSEEIGEYATVGIPMRFANADVGPKRPSPKLGEHTQSILEGLGLDTSEIEALIKQNII